MTKLALTCLRGTFDPAVGSAAAVGSKYKRCKGKRLRPIAEDEPRAGPMGADVMDDTLTVSSDEIIALSRAIDAATDRGDTDEAIRLSAMPWEDARHWLDAHGYPQRADDDG